MARFGFCVASPLIFEYEYSFFSYRHFFGLLKKEDQNLWKEVYFQGNDIAVVKSLWQIKQKQELYLL